MKYKKLRRRSLIRLRATLLGAIIFFNMSCKKMIAVDPPVTSYTAENVYNSDATAISVLTGVYTRFMSTFGGTFATGARSISLLAGLSSDEFTLSPSVTNTTLQGYYKNSLNAKNLPISGSEYWNELFNYIFICNSAIEGLNSTNSLSETVKRQLLGESHFLRALCYFYLVNFFGDVPVVTSTNYKINSTVGREPQPKIYEFITADLNSATELLSIEYLDANLQRYVGIPERVRPTKWAASALLARVYLYNDDYTKAEEYASVVINHSDVYSLSSLSNLFLRNSSESIWQLQPASFGRNTEDGFMFIIPDTGPNDQNPVYLSQKLLNSFELEDQRKIAWLGMTIVGVDSFYFPYKYKVGMSIEPVTEYLMVLRLAEQYLIRAEARIQQGRISDALEDLNIVRQRAGLVAIVSNDHEAVMNFILHERQVEFFAEWGHRWLDLKRTGTVDEVMNEVCPGKGGAWSTYWQWYPLPIDDIQKNMNLIQNDGY